MVQSNGKLYFTADDGIHGNELWASDGSASGTLLVKDIAIGNMSANIISNIFADSTQVYFITYSNGSLLDTIKLWKSDGTNNGTINYHSFTSFDLPIQARIIQKNNNRIFYGLTIVNGDNILGLTDGTNGGSWIVSDSLSSFSQIPNSIPFINNHWIYPTRSTINGSGTEPYSTDGVPGNVMKVTDINPSGGYTSGLNWYFNQVTWGGFCYFVANNGSTGPELWVTDGTMFGTHILSDIYVGNNSCFGISSSGDQNFKPCIAGNNLFFVADDGIHGSELWSMTLLTVPIDESNNLKSPVTIFPNPASTEIKLNIADNDVKLMNIFNSLGESIIQDKIKNSSSTIDIDISGLANGIYIIEMVTINGDIKKKFVKGN